MTYLLPFFFLASIYNIFVCLFFKRDKIRCVCVGANERERESIENLLFFLPPSICFFEREMVEEVCMWD